ncbi:hypothetical protein YN1551_1497 [Sulfolobus islandicus Y.N.15.51]|uniref:Uncharacterized protein n=1 Tax=Saccharolobus islandicus (strain Y.N.15.51 / Yellowstone \|nr:hypothetical protein YN1551_1497 [Sulfolobus islandicus Y.N.15.51]
MESEILNQKAPKGGKFENVFLKDNPLYESIKPKTVVREL